jgi:hypothetical protein
MDSNKNIYVANSRGGLGNYGSVTIYPPLGSSTGLLNEAPIATIAGQFNASCTGMGTPYACCTSAQNGDCTDATGLAFPSSIMLDSSEDIFVTNAKGGSCLAGGGCKIGGSPTGFGSVTGYLPLGSSTGLLSGAPFNTISGQFNSLCEANGIPYGCCTNFQMGSCVDNAMLNRPEGLYVDPVHSNIFVTNSGSVTEYAGGSDGNVAPSLVLAGPNTGFNMPVGIAFDTSFPFSLVVANSGDNEVNAYHTPLSSGDPTPESTITNGIFAPAGIEILEIGGQQLTFVANGTGATITVYDVDGTLLSTLGGLNTGLNHPVGVLVIPSP